MKRKKKIIRIAILGPESAGKSTLTQKLARHYNTVWVPEYAREYLNNLGHSYELKDILNIAKGQLDAEKQIIKSANRFLFADTELIVTKIWAEVKFNTCPKWILKNIEKNRYDFYLLCYVDTPWEYDPLREHPHMREHLFDLYYKELEARGVDFYIVKGDWEERFTHSVEVIDRIFDTEN